MKKKDFSYLNRKNHHNNNACVHESDPTNQMSKRIIRTSARNKRIAIFFD